MIAIVDYGLGNVASIRNMFKKVGVPAIIASWGAEVSAADKLVLPGVGAFDEGIERLAASGLIPVLERKILNERVPVLGLCLGMQLMTGGSEEGQRQGLGWIEGATVRLRTNGHGLKVPNMGWRQISIVQPRRLFASPDSAPRYYFAHSFHVSCPVTMVAATVNYGYEFPAAIEHGNIFGVQFHPEKSHRYGLELLQRFSAL